MFIDEETLKRSTWQSFERQIARLLLLRGYSGVRVVGGSGDKGADLIAIKNNKRWLIQAKHWKKPVGERVLRETIEAGRAYKAIMLVVASLNGYEQGAREYQKGIIAQGHHLTLWTIRDLVGLAKNLREEEYHTTPRGDYQKIAIDSIKEAVCSKTSNRGMVVMATGLGKTFTAAEAIRQVREERNVKLLVMAHTNSLLEQLEKAFWPFLNNDDRTLLWTQHEKPDKETLKSTNNVFASRDSVANYIKSGGELDGFDVVLIDECHHAHSNAKSYLKIIEHTRAGKRGGPFLLGLTATPFLVDEAAELDPIFGSNPLVTIDMIYGLRHGFLSQIDYRLHTDNINWEGLKDLKGRRLTPRQINKVLFITEWDEAVIQELQRTWGGIDNPKAIVFCGTIEHALSMRDRINARGFCRAEAIYSGEARGKRMTQYERNLLLCDFQQGDVNIVCAVDVFNEGIDVPDVNIVVFNRVTHSRRIFIQQLGRGLRITDDKKETLVLDFAQDIRRYAAGLKLKDSLCTSVKRGIAVSIGNKVIFKKVGGEDKKTESFLRAWIEDVEKIESAGEDSGVLQFPPAIEG